MCGIKTEGKPETFGRIQVGKGLVLRVWILS